MAIVLGGGLTGLSAAYELSKKGPVTLIEKDNELGGALSSYERNGYSIEKFYHHCFSGDNNFIGLVHELGLAEKLKWLPATTAFYDSRFHNLSGAMDILGFRLLSKTDRLRLVRLMLRIKTYSNEKVRKLDTLSAKEWIILKGGEGIWENFFEPMLVSKFGPNAGEVSASWFIERMKIRSNRGLTKEKLGYMEGGFHQVIDNLEKKILENGGKITKGSSAAKILIKEDSVCGVAFKGKSIKDSCVISTLAPEELLKISYLPDELTRKLKKLEYQGCISVMIGMRKKLTDFYWTNLIGARKHFGAIVEHTNFISPSLYGREHILYLASYPPAGSSIWHMSDKKVAEIYINDLRSLMPEHEIDVSWSEVFRLSNAGLVYRKGILENMPEVSTSVKGLYIGGMFNSYPERSMDLSIGIGKKCAGLANDFSKSAGEKCSH